MRAERWYLRYTVTVCNIVNRVMEVLGFIIMASEN